MEHKDGKQGVMETPQMESGDGAATREAAPQDFAHVFADIGRTLAEARKAQDIDLEEIGRHLRLSESHVTALEAGDSKPFFSHVYIIGHIRSYAKFVGMDSEEICARLHAAGDTRAAGRSGDAPTGGNGGRRKSRNEKDGISDFIPEGMIPPRTPHTGRMAMAALGLLALVYGGWYTWDTGLIGGGNADGDAAIIADAEDDISPAIEIPADAEPVIDLAATDTDTDTNTDTAAPVIIAEGEAVSEPELIEPGDAGDDSAAVVADASPSVIPETAALSTTPPRTGRDARANNRNPDNEIIITATAVSWVEILRADGSAVSSGLMRAGDEYIVFAEDEVYLTTGNAGGLEIRFNGREAARLGAVGETISELPLDPELLSERY